MAVPSSTCRWALWAPTSNSASGGRCRAIPYGQTVAYGQIARQIGSPAASRAVGMANGRNPIGIIVPCHRVVGSTGHLTGYGGGLERKQLLLDFERGVATGQHWGQGSRVS